ncbi:hypothetical protein BJF83_24780 [Nocardiopsis sp. CNR-923]|uniref:hypothetical protein n=1 Tax=Nocardiopsis sp. CNR-923 TaxID=1904965 RepID=UPI00095E6B04|nr:hypothetical protein [Nocardiopsis sp. CNR-923]OLT30471.1 hypothetical protein BJF83_24780 [Nocardiopsis sp. CNR-923]
MTAPMTWRELARLSETVDSYARTMPTYTGSTGSTLQCAAYVADQTALGHYDAHPDGPQIRAYYSDYLAREADDLNGDPHRGEIANALRDLARFITSGDMALTLPPELAAVDASASSWLLTPATPVSSRYTAMSSLTATPSWSWWTRPAPRWPRPTGSPMAPSLGGTSPTPMTSSAKRLTPETGS